MLGEELTEYSRSCPAWLACGSGQERGKAEKKMTKVRSLHWSHIVIILVVDRLGQIYDNIHCHLMQNKALNPLAKPATEWVVELKGHRGGALCNEQLSLFRDSEPVSCVVLPKES